MEPKAHLQIPPSHTALSGDLHVQLTLPADGPQYEIRLFRVDGGTPHHLYGAAVRRDARSNNLTIVRLPCGLFSRGGDYYVDLVDTEKNETEAEDSKVSKGIYTFFKKESNFHIFFFCFRFGCTVANAKIITDTRTCPNLPGISGFSDTGISRSRLSSCYG